jgi:hypothetical protein
MRDGEDEVEEDEPPYERMFQRAVEVFTGTDQERVLIKVRRAIQRDDEPKVRSLLAKAYIEVTATYALQNTRSLSSSAKRQTEHWVDPDDLIGDALNRANDYIGRFERAEGKFRAPTYERASPFDGDVEQFVGVQLHYACLDWKGEQQRRRKRKDDPPPPPPDTEGEVKARQLVEDIVLARKARAAIIGQIRAWLDSSPRPDLRSPDLRVMKRTKTYRRLDRVVDPTVRRFLTGVEDDHAIRIPPEATVKKVQDAFREVTADELTEVTRGNRDQIRSRFAAEPRYAVMLALVVGLDQTHPEGGTAGDAAHWNMTEMLIELQGDYVVRRTKQLANHLARAPEISASRFREDRDEIMQFLDRIDDEGDRPSKIRIATGARSEVRKPGRGSKDAPETKNPSAFERATALVGTDHPMASQAQDLLDLDDRLAWMIREAGGSTEADDPAGPNDDHEGGDPA